MVSLKVDGLSTRTHIDDLESLFEKYGKVGDVYKPKKDGYNGYNKGGNLKMIRRLKSWLPRKARGGHLGNAPAARHSLAPCGVCQTRRSP